MEADLMLAARRLPEAVMLFCASEEAGASPDLCASGRWIAFMLLGEYEDAWQESDSIRSRALPDPHRFWHGENLVGQRVIVRCLHGYGDAVQFLRYSAMLKAIASELIVEVPPRFVELARCFDGIDHVITWGENAPAQPHLWDVQLEVMELPYIFRTQVADLPLYKNYLHVPPALLSEGRQQAPLTVGLAWNSGSWNPARSISLDILRPLLSVVGCEFWSLCEDPQSLIVLHPTGMLLKEHSDCRNSIEGLAATIAALDLVITVDTLAAHLGGALGIKTWVLLPYVSDWRWMHERSDSPWYPSIQLFRQPAPGSWAPVISSVHRELQTLTRNKRGNQVIES